MDRLASMQRTRLAAARPSGILAILRSVDAAATLVCNEIDKACATERVERQALKDLRKGVENLKCNIVAYKHLLGVMLKDLALSGLEFRPSSYPHEANNSQYHDHRVERSETLEEMERLKTALEATRLVLEGNPTGTRHGATMKRSDIKRPRRTLQFVLDVLKSNCRMEGLHSIIGDLTNEIFVCQQNNERAVKPVWYRHVAKQQWCDRTSVVTIGGIRDRVWLALDSFLDAFRAHPFAVSPEKIRRRSDLHIFATLNHTQEAVTRHQKLARQIGKAWVDDHNRKDLYGSQVQELGALQTSLFELLWSGTVEQLKRESLYSPDDPEQPEFERAAGELERALKKAIVRLREQRFTIALCGTVEADKSLFLNELMGRAIIPLDGGSHDPRMPHPILNIIAEFPLPCRLRHVKDQRFLALQFHAEPFLVALKKLQTHQYGWMMKTYKPPPKNMFEELPFSGALSESPDEEILLRTIHSQWVNLHAVTRYNLLQFETHGFELPREAYGDLKVKTLVSFSSYWTALCPTERYSS